jgi:hypothetical protein
MHCAITEQDISIFRVSFLAVMFVYILAFFISLALLLYGRYAVAQLVEALRYKPEGRGFDSRWGHWNF